MYSQDRNDHEKYSISSYFLVPFFGGVGFLSPSLPLTQTEIYLHFTQSLYENIRIKRLSEIGHSYIPPTKVSILYTFFSYNTMLDKLIY